MSELAASEGLSGEERDADECRDYVRDRDVCRDVRDDASATLKLGLDARNVVCA